MSMVSDIALKLIIHFLRGLNRPEATALADLLDDAEDFVAKSAADILLRAIGKGGKINPAAIQEAKKAAERAKSASSDDAPAVAAPMPLDVVEEMLLAILLVSAGRHALILRGFFDDPDCVSFWKFDWTSNETPRIQNGMLGFDSQREITLFENQVSVCVRLKIPCSEEDLRSWNRQLAQKELAFDRSSIFGNFDVFKNMECDRVRSLGAQRCVIDKYRLKPQPGRLGHPVFPDKLESSSEVVSALCVDSNGLREMANSVKVAIEAFDSVVKELKDASRIK